MNYLESQNVIPTDVAKAIEIINGRNKIVHGEFIPPDPDYAFPLLQMAIIYFSRITEHWERWTKVNL